MAESPNRSSTPQAARTASRGIGNDLIDGDGGVDTLSGGDGSDTFHFHNLGDGVDTIIDFATGAGGDVLDVADLLFGFIERQCPTSLTRSQCDAARRAAPRSVADGATNGAVFTDGAR